MSNLNHNMHAYNGNSEHKIRSTRKDYSDEVEEMSRQNSHRFISKMVYGVGRERRFLSLPANANNIAVVVSGSKQSFDIKDCRVESIAEGIARCLTSQLCDSCGNSMLFGNISFCKHPLLARKISD